MALGMNTYIASSRLHQFHAPPPTCHNKTNAFPAISAAICIIASINARLVGPPPSIKEYLAFTSSAKNSCQTNPLSQKHLIVVTLPDKNSDTKTC